MTKTTHYKNTPIGPIPTKWEVKKLGDLVEIRSGNSPSDFNLQETGKYPYLKVEDLNNCFKYQLISREYTDDSFKNIIEVNSLIFPKRGAAIINNKIRVSKVNCYLDSNLMALKIINQDKLDVEYLYYKILDVQLFKIADTSSIPQLNNKHINPFIIPLPPLPEQQKIAEVLSTWDKAIQETDALIKKLEERNKALAFSLLTGKKRVKGFDSKWNQTNFGAITKKISRRNKDLIEAEVYSVTNSKGFVLQSEHFEGKVASEDLKTYKIIKNNEFAYNPARINVGSLAYFQNTVGIISSLYVCFKTTSEVSDEYLLAYLQTDYVHSRINALGEGGVRIYLWYELFSKIKINLPSLEEQNAIAGILNTANDELKQYQQKLETLKLQKKGLMQQLLTGKIRTV